MAEKPASSALLYTLIAAQFAPPFMFSGVAVALPNMGADLSAGATALGLVETLFLAGSAAFLLPAGRIADASDKRTLYKLSLLGFALLSFLIAALDSVGSILAVRLLQGMTSTFLAASGPAILSDLVEPERRGRVFGMSLGAIYSGLTLGPVIAGWLVLRFGWRAVFLVGGGAILIAFALTSFMLESRWRSARKGALHAPSIALSVGSILLLIAGAAMIREGALGLALMLGAVVLAIAFVALQHRVSNPLLKPSVLSDNRTLSGALTVQLLVYVGAFSTVFLISLYLQIAHELPPTFAGRTLAISSVVMAIGAPIAGRLSDRFSPGHLSWLGVVCLLSSALLATQLDSASTHRQVVALLIIQGLGFALFSSPNMTTVMNSVSSAQSSMASALSAQSRSLGMVLGMTITTIFTSLYLGDVPVRSAPERFETMASATFQTVAVLIACALVLATVNARRSPRRSPHS